MILRALDLTKSHSLRSRDTAPISFLPQPDRVPEISAAALWGWSNRLYEVGGESEGVDPNFPGFNKPSSLTDISVYDTVTTGWSTRAMMDQQSNDIIRSSHSLHVAIPEKGKAYYLGGILPGDKRESEKVSQLSTYDFAADSWTRSKTRWASRAYGTLSHVPFGDAGLLVALGGFDGSVDGPETGAVPLTRIDMLNLNIPGSSWATPQLATAAVPADGVPSTRMNACTVSAAAPDGSSAQIFLFGGSIPNSRPYTQSGELWALSIPSFEWYLLANSTGDITQKNPGAREGMSCDRIGKHMLMFGGRQLPNFSRPCETTGSYALDLENVEWVEEWDSKMAKGVYKVPKKVVDGIGGSKDGGAIKGPVDKYADPDLSTLFEAHIDAVKASATAEVTPAPPHQTAETKEGAIAGKDDAAGEEVKEGNSMSAGALAGVVVAGVVALVASVGLLYWLVRRCRNEARRKPSIDDVVYGRDAGGGPLPRHISGLNHIGIIPSFTETEGMPERVMCERRVGGVPELGDGDVKQGIHVWTKPAELEGSRWAHV